MKVLISLIIIAKNLSKALVLKYFWKWFIIDYFSLPEIPFVVSLGIVYIITLLFCDNEVRDILDNLENPDREKRTFTTLASILLTTLLIWGVGYFYLYLFS